MVTAELLMCEEGNSQSKPWTDGQLINAHRQGDQAASAELWLRYYPRLIGLVKKEMGMALQEVEDPSDVVQSVFESVFIRGRAGTLRVDTQGHLWPLLAVITLNKIRNRARYWGRQQRNRELTVPLDGHDPLQRGPRPEDAAHLQELVEQLLGPFSARRRETIKYLLEDVPLDEIAKRVGSSMRTIFRTRDAAMEILAEILARS